MIILSATATLPEKIFQSQPLGVGASDAELLCQLQDENEALKAENDALKLQVAELQNYRGKLTVLTYILQLYLNAIQQQ